MVFTLDLMNRGTNIIEIQKIQKDGLFKRYSFDEMKSALEKWLSPEDESEDDIPAPVVESKPSSNFSLDTSKAKSYGWGQRYQSNKAY